jgi:hypothetical protein
MSAFICTDKQFIEAINGFLTHCQHNPGHAKLVEWANILKRENVRSVNHRYNERTRFEPIVFEPASSSYSAWQTINWLRCIDYQSCERPDYNKSEAYRLNMELQLELFNVMNDSRFTNLHWTI